MSPVETLYNVLRATLLAGNSHVLLDVSDVLASPWQGLLQQMIANILTPGWAGRQQVFTITPDTSPEILSEFVASCEFARQQITHRAEVTKRRTVSMDSSTCVSDMPALPDGTLELQENLDIESAWMRHKEGSLLDPLQGPAHQQPHSLKPLHLRRQSIPRSGTAGPSPGHHGRLLRFPSVMDTPGADEPFSKRFMILIQDLQNASLAVQTCLLEALEHCQVVSEGTLVRLTGKLTVVATLQAPAIQLQHVLKERFMASYVLCPELFISSPEVHLATPSPVWDMHQRVGDLSRTLTSVTIASVMDRYIRRIATAARQHFAVGFDFPHWNVTRHLTTMAKAWALLHGRKFVIPADVSLTAPLVFAHRITIHGDWNPEVSANADVTLCPVQMDPWNEDYLFSMEGGKEASISANVHLVNWLLSSIEPPG
uniref:magnesium chelatase n=1 Tax=Eutreptiella gymnastica TaxID=73025 RepID=A0A7S1N2N6_9EUGL|mmetsp:Transcript_109737/g.190105  ORF Transcript_109737/g.190105 Transcript_109737/m.190105 type:complete len:427 (+) Transcript_109737:58-1338(+)